MHFEICANKVSYKYCEIINTDYRAEISKVQYAVALLK